MEVRTHRNLETYNSLVLCNMSTSHLDWHEVKVRRPEKKEEERNETECRMYEQSGCEVHIERIKKSTTLLDGELKS